MQHPMTCLSGVTNASEPSNALSNRGHACIANMISPRFRKHKFREHLTRLLHAWLSQVKTQSPCSSRWSCYLPQSCSSATAVAKQCAHSLHLSFQVGDALHQANVPQVVRQTSNSWGTHTTLPIFFQVCGLPHSKLPQPLLRVTGSPTCLCARFSILLCYVS